MLDDQAKVAINDIMAQLPPDERADMARSILKGESVDTMDRFGQAIGETASRLTGADEPFTLFIELLKGLNGPSVTLTAVAHVFAAVAIQMLAEGLNKEPERVAHAIFHRIIGVSECIEGLT